ncbi:hypothetical protein CEY12_16910 [Chryseobacterium sp. T16E-39]|uniref:hypothetical protein n=1 Tax=Chryseobacterium sp. T16E-39 TaxID=2015076 RepID=UPI000B5B14B7|nr:hypothetical protein [Chryseobacterium sp. T16E-39]ASK31689.1 hypothetical protein CEY12_16910 [Chryseobacterium sp. T16E-39]
MKFYTFFFIFFTQAFFFGQDIPAKITDSLKSAREIEYKKIFLERLKYYKEQCSNDSIKAVNNSKIENKYFIYLTAPSGDDFPAKKELEEALKNYNIIWGGTMMGSDIPGHYISDLCYHHYMSYFTEKKFGKDFIENIVRQSLLNHLNKNHSVIFEYNEHLNWIYEGDPQLADVLLSQYFFKNFRYPKGYQYSSKENQSFTEVTLELDEENYTLKLEGLNHHFENQQNEQFIPYFEKKIRNFIKSSKFALSRQNVMRNGVKKSFKIYYK